MKNFITLMLFSLFFSVPTFAKRPPWNEDGKFRRAVVVDEGLSALRSAPSPDANCLRRLRTGRSLYIISTVYNQTGVKYHYVAVTRRTRGFVDAAALINPAERADDARLMRIITAAQSSDKIVLCQLLTRLFPTSTFAPQALLTQAELAEQIARDLSQRAVRRPPQQLDNNLDPARYWRNYDGLDKYNRLGLHFLVDERQGTFSYDGAAYQQILAKYPKSAAATIARDRLQGLRVQLLLAAAETNSFISSSVIE